MNNINRISELKKLCPIKEASEFFGIGQHKLRHLCKTDPDLPCVKIGSTIKIIVDLFPKYLEECSKKNKQL